MENQPFVIAGAGLAGATAARTLREAPRALRIIYVLSRRSYARLAATAFGARP